MTAEKAIELIQQMYDKAERDELHGSCPAERNRGHIEEALLHKVLTIVHALPPDVKDGDPINQEPEGRDMSINRKDHVSKLERDLLLKDRQLFEVNKELADTKEEIKTVRNVNQMLRDSILAMKKEIREMLHKYL